MHEFWTLSTGAGKSRMAFAKAVQAHRLSYGGLILDAASVLSTQFIRYLAHIGYPPERTLIIDFGSPLHLGTPVFHLLASTPDIAGYKAVEELVRATVTLSESHSTAGDRQMDLGRRAFLVLQQADRTLGDIDRFCIDPGFRVNVCKKADADLERFWIGHEDLQHKGQYKGSYVDRLPRDSLESLRNKWSGLCLHPLTKPMISSKENPIDLFDLMQQGYWVIVNLSEDHLGEDVQQRVGQLFQCMLKTATIRRQRTTHRPPFLVLCDEYPQYRSSTTHTSLLRLSRNMNIGLIFLCQDTAPFTPQEFFTLTGNCSTLGTGNVSRHDSENMAGEIFLNNTGSTWRDWEKTKNFSAHEELRAYASLIMSLEPGQVIVRVKPSHEAYVVDIPDVEYPPENLKQEHVFREAVATHWYASQRSRMW
jgi:hypothetical protein